MDSDDDEILPGRKYPEGIRRQAVQRHLELGKVRATAREFGISHQTLRPWLKAYRQALAKKTPGQAMEEMLGRFQEETAPFLRERSRESEREELQAQGEVDGATAPLGENDRHKQAY